MGRYGRPLLEQAQQAQKLRQDASQGRRLGRRVRD